jgi:hypothetical protein
MLFSFLFFSNLTEDSQVESGRSSGKSTLKCQQLSNDCGCWSGRHVAKDNKANVPLSSNNNRDMRYYCRFFIAEMFPVKPYRGTLR